MKNQCKICKELKETSKPRFIRIEHADPRPPFTQKQLIAKNLVMCDECYEKFQNGEVDINLTS